MRQNYSRLIKPLMNKVIDQLFIYLKEFFECRCHSTANKSLWMIVRNDNKFFTSDESQKVENFFRISERVEFIGFCELYV